MELLAIFYALQSLYKDCQNTHIEFQSDNVSAVSYVNDFGGMTSELMDGLARLIWQWCLDRQIFLSAVHIPGTENVVADFYSRNFSDSTEWTLKQDIFERLCRQYFVPDIDLFASRMNNQLDTFATWFPEPDAEFVNAFSQSWDEFEPYLFPPFNLVGRVLNKLVQDKVDQALLVFPFWPSQAWFPLLLESLCSFPTRLPRHRDLLTMPHSGEMHPLAKRLKIIAAIVSGKRSRVEAFRQKLHSSSFSHGQRELTNSTDMHGNSGICGMVSGLVIPFIRLKQQ